jgi:hypothetical protein
MQNANEEIKVHETVVQLFIANSQDIRDYLFFK